MFKSFLFLFLYISFVYSKPIDRYEEDASIAISGYGGKSVGQGYAGLGSATAISGNFGTSISNIYDKNKGPNYYGHQDNNTAIAGDNSIAIGAIKGSSVEFSK